ncbi:MAG TPA: hypothetical protein GYA07_08055 [Verrucomicrobia bacterium]|nr:hypothetical protein [Verrucomicrobiota bacterium]HOP96492.1 hypothetical protein [Verrucomicrobiota bacterium]
MKREKLLKSLLVVFVGTVAFYAATYFAIEHARHRKGPWIVTFTRSVAGEPEIVIHQPVLGISNVTIRFAGEPPAANLSSAGESNGATRTNSASTTIAFDSPKPVPYDVPFGQCIFMDTTFLPGTVVFDLFGHEIQLIPRVLTVDREEKAWVSGAVHTLTSVNTNAAGTR